LLNRTPCSFEPSKSASVTTFCEPPARSMSWGRTAASDDIECDVHAARGVSADPLDHALAVRHGLRAQRRLGRVKRMNRHYKA